MPLPDALREALGQVIAEQRREWRREREVIVAQGRQLLADAQRTVAELRAQIVELQVELRAKVDARLTEIRDGSPGERGPQGERGEVGPVGPQGERGELGEQGPAGERGEIGPAGEPGPRGERGDTGPAGPTGEQGIQGEPGARGEAGQDGPRGEPGERGPQGEVGPQGERGEQGPQGAAGDTGLAGERGPQGERGETGPVGPAGERGESGPQGERGVEGPAGKLPAISGWEDQVHRESDVVAHAGAVYQARRDTGKAPPHEDWNCIVAAAHDGRSFNPRSTYSADEAYARLDVVTLDGGAFVARRDDPGPCPGEGWMLLVMRGKAGKPGVPGPQGKGVKGDPGPAVVELSLDETGMVTLTNADGTMLERDFAPVLSRLGR